MQQVNLKIKNLIEMEELATTLASYIEEYPVIIFLDGDLGAGKTTFTQFLAKSLGVKDVVTSPTFNIFKRYQGEKRVLNHFDLYRIHDQVYDQGFEEYWNNDNEISVIEWASYLPNEFKSIAKIQMQIKVIDENRREITFLAQNAIISYLKENTDGLIYR